MTENTFVSRVSACVRVISFVSFIGLERHQHSFSNKYCPRHVVCLLRISIVWWKRMSHNIKLGLAYFTQPNSLQPHHYHVKQSIRTQTNISLVIFFVNVICDIIISMACTVHIYCILSIPYSKRPKSLRRKKPQSIRNFVQWQRILYRIVYTCSYFITVPRVHAIGRRTIRI